MSHTSFLGNVANIDGGGIDNAAGAILTSTADTFVGNTAQYGGGLFNGGGGDPDRRHLRQQLCHENTRRGINNDGRGSTHATANMIADNSIDRYPYYDGGGVNNLGMVQVENARSWPVTQVATS